LAIAQVIPSSERPGRVEQRFATPEPARARPSGVVIKLPEMAEPAGAAATPLLIKGFVIDGATVFSREELSPLYLDVVGHESNVAAIFAVARKITAKYGAAGYVLSRAIVPPQPLDPKGAVVHLRVAEGFVDKVEWPEKLSRYRNFFTDYAAKITAERPANIHTIERYMLLAGDLPGLKFSTTLRASANNPGASTLVVQMEEKPFDAQSEIDNRGTRARGPLEFFDSAAENNLLGLHESIALTYAAALPLRTLEYLSGSYRQVLTSEGLSLFIDANHSWGRPGTAPLEALQYAVRGTNFDVGFAYPIIRQREQNLTISGLGFAEDDDADTLGAPLNRDRIRGARLKLDGDWADAWQGINQFNVTFSQGVNGFGSTANGNPLASRAVGRVDFTKIEATLSRTQPLFDRFSVFGSLYGQYAFTPLLTPEQCGYGGQYFGRAFDPSELLGDRCFLALGELRYDLPKPIAQLTRLQLYGFADYGHLFELDAAPGTPASIEAASIGGGLRVELLDKFKTDLQVAKAVEGPRNDWRFFFVASAHY
jgi:hemolysin activation/secretion protein